MFEVFIECADRIEQVTTDLLDLSRVDREEQCTFAPGRGLAASVRLMETRFGDAIQIERDIDETTSVHGRAGDLHHVFLNVLDNAARAMDSKGRLRVQGQREGEWYVVRVEDDGPGIPEALTATVFEHFVTTRAAGEGTGLGLAIAREILQSHKGTIVAGKSDLGGALLEMRLPIA
jgi:signal transduction histidine kinase